MHQTMKKCKGGEGQGHGLENREEGQGGLPGAGEGAAACLGGEGHAGHQDVS